MSAHHQVVIIGGGSAGIATAASMLKRRPSLDLAIVEPSEEHFYQPGWTMVGGGIFKAPVTRRTMASVMPDKAKWIRQAAASFQPDSNRVTLEDGSVSVNVTSTAGNTGGNQPFNIKDPFLGLQYCVVQFGIFPSRN